jgi:hypothetical protein
VITLRAEDLPNPDAAATEVTLPAETVVRLGQSIVAWADFVASVGATCGTTP